MFEAAPQGSMKVPLRIYASDALFEKMKSDRTLLQAANVATLPGILGAMMVMPDGHEGYGFPIGGVAGFDAENGVVSPGGVGYDINCGVRLLRTNLTEKDIKPKMKQLTKALFDNIPSGVGSKSKIRPNPQQMEEAVTTGMKWALEQGYAVEADLEHCEENGHFDGADFSKVSVMAKKRGTPQFGTLGSGNHFLEVQKVEKIFDPVKAKAFGITGEGQVTVMIHSGSRGLGHQVCDDYLRTMLPKAKDYGLELADRELCCAPISSSDAQDYLGAMRCAINFAFNNRQVMTSFARNTFQQVLGGKWEDYDMSLVYDVCHNIAKFEEHDVDGKRTKVCVHRKGATRALWPGNELIPKAYRSVGQPVIIPGSMNTASYLLCGGEGSRLTFGSSCHGAGRVMSRSQAKRDFNSTDIIEQMQREGVDIQVAERNLLAEEYGKAYKDVNAVVQAVEDAGISTIVAKLVPMGVIKG